MRRRLRFKNRESTRPWRGKHGGPLTNSLDDSCDPTEKPGVGRLCPVRGRGLVEKEFFPTGYVVPKHSRQRNPIVPRRQQTGPSFPPSSLSRLGNAGDRSGACRWVSAQSQAAPEPSGPAPRLPFCAASSLCRPVGPGPGSRRSTRRPWPFAGIREGGRQCAFSFLRSSRPCSDPLWKHPRLQPVPVLSWLMASSPCSCP